MSIEKLVNVQISRQTSGVTQAGFGVSLILGPNAVQGEIRSYSNIAGVAEDFDVTDAEYLMAQKMFSQTPRPQQVRIGYSSGDFTSGVVTTEIQNAIDLNPDFYFLLLAEGLGQKTIVTPEAQTLSFDATPDAGLITLSYGGEETAAIDFDDLAADVQIALRAIAGLEAVTVTGSFAAGFEITFVDVVEPLTLVVEQNTLEAAAVPVDASVAITTPFVAGPYEGFDRLVEAAEAIEARKRLLGIWVNNDEVKSNAADDIASELRDLGLVRTFFIYSSGATSFAASALIGRVSPLNPGSETWANKTLAGVATDNLTQTEQNNLDAKNVNYYVNIGGLGTTINGKVAEGEYIDVVRFIDWLTARMGEEVFRVIKFADKVAYTDAGIAEVESAMRTVLKRGVATGGIPEGDWEVTVPKARDIPTDDKAARVLRNMRFRATLAGAIHAVEIFGEVTL